MSPLKAAASGAVSFAKWAKAQGCDTKLLVDAKRPVEGKAILDAVDTFVRKHVYSQLIIYFAGHGLLLAPQSEYWLLTDAGNIGSECVNLARAREDARDSGVPHVVFISDACRSEPPPGPPWNKLVGYTIFKSDDYGTMTPEVDTFYATRPALSSIEAPIPDDNSKTYRGIFTAVLLEAVKKPERDWLVTVPDGRAQLTVVPSRPLKPYLEKKVAEEVAKINVRYRQKPEVRVESAPPNFFASVIGAAAAAEPSAPPEPPPPPAPEPETEVPAPAAEGPPAEGVDADAGGEEIPSPAPSDAGHAEAVESPGLELTDRLWDNLKLLPSRAAMLMGAHLLLEPALGRAPAVEPEVETVSAVERDLVRLLSHHRPELAERQTGFTVVGTSPVHATAPGWEAHCQPATDSDVDQPRWQISLEPGDSGGRSILISFGEGHGTLLPILPGFSSLVDVAKGQVVSVNYVPSPGTDRHPDYAQRAKELEVLKALTAVATRDGRLVFEGVNPAELADRVRQAKGIDPAMGLYAAYAYAQAGKYEQAFSVYSYMEDDRDLPQLFDVVMLAARLHPHVAEQAWARIAPRLPLLGQGWSLLQEGDPLYRGMHGELRSHLVPSLWTTFTAEGTERARALLEAGELG